MDMRYSVLMSIYKNEEADYFYAAMDSMLNQTVPPDDFVLVCDGMLTPELDAVAKQFAAKYPDLLQIIRLPENQGLANALAVGIQACRYELVARMDSDDYAHPQRMEWQLHALENNDLLAAIGGAIAEFGQTIEDAAYIRKVPLSNSEIRKMLPYRNPMNHMTVTYRKFAVLSAGSYENYLWHEDYQLWAKMLQKGFLFQNLDKICVYARTGNGFIKRRSGWNYFQQSVRLQSFLRKSGWISVPRFCRNVLVRFFGYVLLPDSARSFAYRLLLREKNVEN